MIIVIAWSRRNIALQRKISIYDYFFKKMLEDRKWCDHGMWSSEIHLYFDRKDFIFDVNVSCQIIKRLLCRKSKDIQMHIKK